MPIKIQIVGQSLVVTDTSDSTVLLDAPKSDYYYVSETLENKDKIALFNTDFKSNIYKNPKQIDLSEAIDDSDTPFTKSSFIDFCRNNLGAGDKVEVVQLTQTEYDNLSSVGDKFYVITDA